jgi:hypothetical protein
VPRVRASTAATLMTFSSRAGSQLLASAMGGEVRAPGGGQAVQGLLVGHGRDAEPRALHEVFLHGVHELRVLPRPEDDPGRLVAQLAGPRDLADPVAEDTGRLGRVELTLVVRDAFLALPDGEGLRDLLLERHAGEQVEDPLVDGPGGVAVGRPVLGERGERSREQEQGKAVPAGRLREGQAHAR